MKKILAIALVLVMVFAVVACGGNEVADYVDSFNNSSEGKQIVTSLEESGIEMKITADGNNVIFKARLLLEVPDETLELLKSSMGDITAGLSESTAQMRKECSSIDKIVVEYYTVDNSLIASAEA